MSLIYSEDRTLITDMLPILTYYIQGNSFVDPFSSVGLCVDVLNMTWTTVIFDFPPHCKLDGQSLLT